MLEHVQSRKIFRNQEGLRDYEFTLFRTRRNPGVSAMVRVKNEQQKIEMALRSILPLFDEIVVVDNGSTDGTVQLVRDVKQRFDEGGIIKLFSYPHKLGRFGPEHGSTPADSVHSAVYFTNWALSRCSHDYVCKWDGDMVMRREARVPFLDLLRRIQDGRKTCWVLAGQTVYRDLSGGFHLSRGEVNKEIELFPYGLPYRFIKNPSCERFRRPFYLPRRVFQPVCFYELKYVDEDEFDHWSTTDWPGERKRREWMNFHRIREGRLDASFDRRPPTFLSDQIAADGADVTSESPNQIADPTDQLKARLPPPQRPVREVPAIKQWFGRTKRRLGYYEARNRLHETRFRRCLRPTDVFLVGHPKSGNTWLAYMLALLTHGDGGHEINLYSVGDFVPFVHANDNAIEQYEHLSSPRVFRNEYPLHRRLYPRILYILRDPRSVLVSFWHMYRVMFDDEDMTLVCFVDQYLRCTGIFSYWNKHLVRWDRQVRQALSEARNGRRIHLVRYEDLVSDRRRALEGVARFIELPTDDTWFAHAVERGSFEAMRETEDRFGAEAYTGRARGAGRFIRKGEVDGWRREMDEAISERLLQEFGPVMAEAGYL